MIRYSTGSHISIIRNPTNMPIGLDVVSGDDRVRIWLDRVQLKAFAEMVIDALSKTAT